MFPEFKGNGVTVNGGGGGQSNNLLTRLQKKAGLKKKISPHVFRRTCATALLNKGLSLLEVQRQLRHKSNRSTLVYLKLCELEDLGRRMKELDW